MPIPYRRQEVQGTYKNKYAFEGLDPIRPCKSRAGSPVPGCGRMTRPSKLKAAKAPGTVPRADGYLCSSCKRKEDEAKPAAKPRPEAAKPTKYDSAKIARIDELNTAYLLERRRRLAKPKPPYVRQIVRTNEAHLDYRLSGLAQRQPDRIPPGAGRRRTAQGWDALIRGTAGVRSLPHRG